MLRNTARVELFLRVNSGTCSITCNAPASPVYLTSVGFYRQCVVDFTSLRFCSNTTTKYNSVLNQSAALVTDDFSSTDDVTAGTSDVTAGNSDVDSSEGDRNASSTDCLPASHLHFPEVSGHCLITGTVIAQKAVSSMISHLSVY